MSNSRVSSPVALVVAVIFASLCIVNLHGQRSVSAIPLLGLRCAGNFVVGYVSDRIIERNPMVANFKNVSQKIIDRVDKEVDERGITDKAQIEALYHRISIDEIRQLKEQLERQRGEQNQRSIEELDKELSAQTEALNSCENKQPQMGNPNQALDVDEDKELEEEEERRLNGDIELVEKEMGAGLSEADKMALQARTRGLLGDLLQNEVRQLALSCMAAYAQGGPMGAILASFGQTIKTKLVKYFLNVIYDLFGTALGRPIQPQVVEVDAAKSKPTKQGGDNRALDLMGIE